MSGTTDNTVTQDYTVTQAPPPPAVKLSSGMIGAKLEKADNEVTLNVSNGLTVCIDHYKDNGTIQVPIENRFDKDGNCITQVPQNDQDRSVSSTIIGDGSDSGSVLRYSKTVESTILDMMSDVNNRKADNTLQDILLEQVLAENYSSCISNTTQTTGSAQIKEIFSEICGNGGVQFFSNVIGEDYKQNQLLAWQTIVDNLRLMQNTAAANATNPRHYTTRELCTILKNLKERAFNVVDGQQ
jgi:hypothetical protein